MAVLEKTKDKRKLERTGTPGVYRRHANGCKRKGRCHCPYVVVWKQASKQHKQMFGTYELAREHKNKLGSGLTTRRPLSSDTVGAYYETWIESYRGRTKRGLEESTRGGYEDSFRRRILPLPIARVRMRELVAPDVRDWLAQLERQGATPSMIRLAKAGLSVMLATAVEDGDIGSNPAIGVRYLPTEAAKRQHAKPKPKRLGAADAEAIFAEMHEQWRAFFVLLTVTGLRIGELLGLTWDHVHLGDDPHIMVAEQVYKGKRKQLKTDASMARVPLSASMASWLSGLRPLDVADGAPVFATKTGGTLNYANVYNRVLRPALVDAGIAVKVGEDERERPVYDYQGVAFHAFRHACLTLLDASGKRRKQVQGWARHAQAATTELYIHQADDGLGGADVWDEILPGAIPEAGATPGATRHPEAAANPEKATAGEPAR
jgi:integrase